MLSSLFSRKILAGSSVTGKRKEGRPALKTGIVHLIICNFVTNMMSLKMHI